MRTSFPVDGSTSGQVSVLRGEAQASSSAASDWDNAVGSGRGSRRRSDERFFGRRTVWASIPLRSPATRQRASRPFGTGLVTSGSRIAAKANRPEIAASRRLIVVAAY